MRTTPATTTTTTTTTQLWMFSLVGVAFLCCNSSVDAFHTTPGSGTSAIVRAHQHHSASRLLPASGPRRNGHGARQSGTVSPPSTILWTASSSLPSEDTSATAMPPPPPPPLWERPGVGMLRDIRARLPFYRSDLTDGLSVQCLAATLFLFFACLAPAIGFGGMFDVATGGAMGTVEMVTSTAACGVVYALTAAQPLTIIGSTGPVLAFVACLAQLARAWSLPFLPLYAWTGLWTAGILGMSALTSASHWVRYLTRFTDEIFSALISAIFVVEAVSDVGRTFVGDGPLTKALLTLVTASLTFVTATTLKKIRRSVYFNAKIRTAVSNFAPTIGVVTGALVARWALLAHGSSVAGLPSLALPSVFGTTSGRPWLVPLLDLPVWARWAAAGPALMATVLLFLDQNITVRLVNNPRYKMIKGRRKNNVVDGMHWDLFVVACLTAAQSVVGLPWLVAATVRSLSHVNALGRYDANTNTGHNNSVGNNQLLTSTTEQRVTGVAVHALIGGCVLSAGPRQLLTHVPLPVLMGLFLYLGTSALPGNELWERAIGVVKDKSVAPKERWTGVVPKKVLNRFTLLQAVCLAIMFGVKGSKVVGVLFPVVIALLAPLRFALERTGIIPKEYMDVLDEE